MDGEIEAKIEKKEFIVEMNFPIVTDAKQYFAIIQEFKSNARETWHAILHFVLFHNVY